MALGSISRNIPQQKVAAEENRTQEQQPPLMLSPHFPFIDYPCSPVSALERGIEISNLILHTIFLTGNICQTSVYLFIENLPLWTSLTHNGLSFLAFILPKLLLASSSSKLKTVLILSIAVQPLPQSQLHMLPSFLSHPLAHSSKSRDLGETSGTSSCCIHSVGQ